MGKKSIPYTYLELSRFPSFQKKMCRAQETGILCIGELRCSEECERAVLLSCVVEVSGQSQTRTRSDRSLLKIIL